MDQATLNAHVERVLDGLGREFADEIPPNQVTCEELRSCGRLELSDAA